MVQIESARMEIEREDYRTALNDMLFWLFSDKGEAYVIRLLLLLVSLIASGIFLYFIDIRYWALIPLAYVFSFISAARYLNDLYELSDLGLALNYLLSAALSPNARQSITVANGKLLSRSDEVNLIELIGGPGILYVQPGNLVLLEKLTGLSRVVGAGAHELRRYEYVREVVNLELQHYTLTDVSGITVDGIPVQISDINIRFRLRRSLRTLDDFYDEVGEGRAYWEAVRNQASNRLVLDNELLSLQEMVRLILEDAVKKYINRHTIDQILTPDDRTRDSRQALKDELMTQEVREQLKKIGVELENPVDLGTFEFPDAPIDRYRLGKWREIKRGEIKVMEAEGKAYELSRQDAVRSRTQAEMIQGIIAALQDLNIQDVQDLDTLIKLRTAQILDTWSGLYTSKDEDDSYIKRFFREDDGEEE
jgi:hypothetical protein